MPASENGNKLTPAEAYLKVMSDLRQPNCPPGFLEKNYGSDYFRYGQDGYGLRLSGRIAFISHANGEGLVQADHFIHIDPKSRYIDTSHNELQHIDKIVVELDGDAVWFAAQVANHWREVSR